MRRLALTAAAALLLALALAPGAGAVQVKRCQTQRYQGFRVITTALYGTSCSLAKDVRRRWRIDFDSLSTPRTIRAYSAHTGRYYRLRRVRREVSNRFRYVVTEYDARVGGRVLGVSIEVNW